MLGHRTSAPLVQAPNMHMFLKHRLARTACSAGRRRSSCQFGRPLMLCKASPMEEMTKDLPSPEELNLPILPTTKDKLSLPLNLRLSMDIDELYNSEVECPHGFVLGVIQRQADVQVARPNETLEAIIPRLAKFTGLPVVDESEKVIGVISRKDIIRVRRANGSLEQLVKAHMTSPAITIRATATVQEAADVMLQRKIRRIPVVDEFGAPLGIVSRTDIFKPLFKEAYQSFGALELEAMSKGLGIETALGMKPTWAIKYLYDGDCSMCQGLVAVLKRNDRKNQINYVNIQDDGYRARDNMGVELDEAMETIHAIYPDGRVLLGTEALRTLFEVVGLGWAARLSELPIVAWFVDLLYEFLSANRISLGNTFDAIIASKRIDQSKKGVETCGDVDEGCLLEW